MASIELKHSGGNGVIIAAPTSNPASDKTLTLPSDVDGTVVSKDSSNSLQNIAGINGGQLGNRNLVINGAMQVAQRGNVSSVTSGYGGADRFKFDSSGAAVVTLRQQGAGNSPTDQGFGFCQQIDVTTADSSLAAGDYALISYRFEGQDLQQLKKGTANAQQVTLSFYIKSPKTGTHIVELVDQSNSGRHVNKSYTVSSADTWEKKTVTFPMETSNTITNDNARRMDLNWWLAAGSTYSSGTLQTSWGSDTDANRAVGQVNCMDSTDNNIFITGVQLEVGDTATDFEHRSFAVEKSLCMRYFQKYVNIGAIGFVPDNGSKSYSHVFHFPVEFRATPTLTLTNTGSTSGQFISDGDTVVTISSLNAAAHTAQIGEMYFNLSSDLANFRGAYPKSSDSTSRQTTFFFTAEL